MVMYDAHAISSRHLLVGFRSWAWLTVFLSALGGIAVSMALKYADNILKTFAVGISIVLNCSVSTAFLGVSLTAPMVCGVFLVVGSTFLFNRWQRPRGPDNEAVEDELSPLNGQCDSGDEDADTLSDLAMPSPCNSDSPRGHRSSREAEALGLERPSTQWPKAEMATMRERGACERGASDDKSRGSSNSSSNSSSPRGREGFKRQGSGSEGDAHHGGILWVEQGYRAEGSRSERQPLAEPEAHHGGILWIESAGAGDAHRPPGPAK